MPRHALRVRPVEIPAGPLLLRPWRDDDADALARAIVDLDRRFEANPGTGAAERDAYESSRRELKARLARVLAAPRGPA